MNKIAILLIALLCAFAINAEEQVEQSEQQVEEPQSQDEQESAAEELEQEDNESEDSDADQEDEEAQEEEDSDDTEAEEEADLDDSEEDAQEQDAAESDVNSDDSEDDEDEIESSDDEEQEENDEEPEDNVDDDDESEDSEQESENEDSEQDSEDSDDSEVEDERTRRGSVITRRGGRGGRPRPVTKGWTKGDVVAWMNEVLSACPVIKQSTQACENLIKNSSECPDTIQAFATIANAKKACPKNPTVQKLYKLATSSPFNKCKYDCKSKKLNEQASISPAQFTKKLKPLQEKFEKFNPGNNFALHDSDSDSDSDFAVWEMLYAMTHADEPEMVQDEDMGGGGWWCCWGWC